MASLPAGTADPPLVGDRDIDLRYYLGLVLRHRAFLTACAAVGLLVGLVVALVQTPEYQAGVMLQIEPPPPTFASVRSAIAATSTTASQKYNASLKARLTQIIASATAYSATQPHEMKTVAAVHSLPATPGAPAAVAKKPSNAQAAIASAQPPQTTHQSFSVRRTS